MRLAKGRHLPKAGYPDPRIRDMPKITQGTVAQHRAVQHRAVLDAAHRLIVSNHGKVPSIGEIAKEVGLARPSIYRYVSSQHDLMIQLLLLSTESWNEQLKEAVAAAAPEPEKRLCAYVDVTLQLFIQGSHGPLMTAAQQFPEAFSDTRVQQSHAVFKTIVAEISPGISDIETSLLNSAITRGAELVGEGRKEKDVREALYAIARAMVSPAER